MTATSLIRRARAGWTRMLAGGLALAMLVAANACSTPKPEGLEYLRVTVDGQ